MTFQETGKVQQPGMSLLWNTTKDRTRTGECGGRKQHPHQTGANEWDPDPERHTQRPGMTFKPVP